MATAHKRALAGRQPANYYAADILRECPDLACYASLVIHRVSRAAGGRYKAAEQDDLFAAVWLRLIQARDRIANVVGKDGEGAGFNYVARLTQNTILNTLASLGYLTRSENRYLPAEPTLSVDLVQGTFPTRVEGEWVGVAIRQSLDRSPYSFEHMSERLSFLSASEMRIAYYRYQDFSWDKISSLVGLPLPTVHRHWQASLRKIEDAVKNREKPRPNRLTRELARAMSGASIMNPANRWGEPTLWSVSAATLAELQRSPDFIIPDKWVEQESSPLIWISERAQESQRTKPCANANCINGTDGAAHLPRFYRRPFGYSQASCLLCRVGRVNGLWRKCPTCRLWKRLKNLCPLCKAASVTRAMEGLRGFSRFRTVQWRLPRRLSKDKPRLVRVYLFDFRRVAKEMFVPNPLPLGGGQVSWVKKGGWRLTELDDYKWLGGAFVTHFENDGAHMLIFQDSDAPLAMPYRTTVTTTDKPSRVVATVPPLWADDKPRLGVEVIRTVSAGTAKGLEAVED
jgi:DNA-directed RNA polymerase specialized sigma24 family protein